MTGNIQVHIKPTAGGDRITVEVASTASVGELKEAIAAKNGMNSSEQRLIFKGQILKDDDRTIDSYGIVNESVLHLVRGRPPAGSASPGGGSAAAASPAGGAPGPIAAAAGGLGGMGMSDMPPGLHQAMSAALNSPAMQSLLSNPEIIRSMLQANPAVRQIMERNPEVAQILNDPAMLREMMRIGSNPALLREHMRTSDRALSNIEALPEGFNALRRLHEQIQEPLMNAAMAPDDSSASATSPSGGGAAADPLAALLQQALGAAGGGPAPAAGGGANSNTGGAAPNAAPLPNPWAPGGGSGGGGGAGAGGGGGAGMPAGMGPGFPGLGGLGRLDGLGGGMNPSEMMAMMQNPMMQQMMQSVFSNPAAVEALINANPNLRAMADANPMIRSVMYNPEALRAMTDPRNLQQMATMMQQMEEVRNSNPLMGALMGGLSGAPNAGAGAGGFPDMSALAAMLGGGVGAPGVGAGAPGGGLGGLGGLFGMMMPPAAAAPVADPEVTYATQLQQLTDMGFFDRQSSIAALQATGGNVNAAVERLLGGP